MDYARFLDYDDYIIFINGKIYSLKRNKFIKPGLKDGYYRIELTKNKKSKKFYLHRILGECFIKNPHNFQTIDHIDRDPQNNKISNLRWASRTLQSINKNITKRNKTGVNGVKFCKYNKNYITSWSINYKRFTKTFSLNKYGDKEAKELAIKYRAKMFEKHYKNVI